MGIAHLHQFIRDRFAAVGVSPGKSLFLVAKEFGAASVKIGTRMVVSHEPI